MIESIDKAQLLSHVCDRVCDRVSKGLVPSLFHECVDLWKYLQDTKELEYFINFATDKYIIIHSQHSKGKE